MSVWSFSFFASLALSSKLEQVSKGSEDFLNDHVEEIARA